MTNIEEIMIKHCYLIVFDNETFEIDVDSLKTAVCKAADYWGGNHDLFQKSLKGFEETDIDGIIKLYNYFCQVAITKVYEIKSVLWEEEKKNV